MGNSSNLSHRSLWGALVLGGLPAILAWHFLDGVVQGGDLLFSLGAFPLALLLSQCLPKSPQGGSIPLWLPFLVLLGFAGTGVLRLEGPVTNDEHAYLVQAEQFSKFQLSEPMVGPACPDGIAHCPTHYRQMLEITAEDGSVSRVAKYPLGTSLALVPGVWMGWPWLSVLVAGLMNIWLIRRLAEEWNMKDPRWASLLIACSPFFLLVQTSYQSEVFTLPAAMGVFLLLTMLRKGSVSTRWGGIGVGALCGWVFFCRPLTGVVLAGSCLPAFFCAAQAQGKAVGVRRIGWAILGGIPFLIDTLVWNWLQTGSLWTAPYELYAQRFGPFDAHGQPLDVYGRGDWLMGLWRQVARSGVSVWGTLGIWVLSLWGLLRLKGRDGGAALCFALALPAAYAFHWYPGHWAYLGPLYNFELLGLWTLGALFLLEKAPDSWRRNLPMAAAIAGIAVFMHRFRLAEDWAAIREAPQMLASSSEELPGNAVVLLPFTPQSGKMHTPSRPPFAPNEVVFLRALRSAQETKEALGAMRLEDRPIWRFIPGGERSFDRFEPLATD
ncbi:MAG: hypothetical protein MK213_04640 [Planctomycetes bacterium]|nr:hypothetical protein [Planctomycetota bacterium]